MTKNELQLKKEKGEPVLENSKLEKETKQNLESFVAENADNLQNTTSENNQDEKALNIEYLEKLPPKQLEILLDLVNSEQAELEQNDMVEKALQQDEKQLLLQEIKRLRLLLNVKTRDEQNKKSFVGSATGDCAEKATDPFLDGFLNN